jgi:ATP-dependent DNA helicase RecQ
MHGYVLTETCREVYLRNYFGDTSAKPCGHCDNCLKSESDKTSTPTSEEIEMIFELLKQEQHSVEELCHLSALGKHKVVQAVQYLIKEEKATTNPSDPGFYVLI